MTQVAKADVFPTTLLEELRRSFSGDLVTPDSSDYDQLRRVWNGSIDRHPGLIARCADVSDVQAAVHCASKLPTPVAVRGGGHSFPGLSVCDDGLVVDLGRMNQIQVDPESRTARVQAGALLGDVDQATQPHGLAMPSGIVTHTGVAGLTLGGGIGWLMRKHGLTIDNLLGVELVTAAGDVVHADENDNADLFWGVRGGGGNFGIVTEFEFRLHEVGPVVLAGPIFWRLSDSPEVLRFYRDWSASAPDELMTMVIHRKAPAADFVPPELHGEPVVAVISCYAGPIEEGQAVIEPMRTFGRSVLDLCAPKPYLQHQSMFDPAFPHGWWYYMRACNVDALSNEVLDITVEHAGQIESPLTSFPIWQFGGAVARVPEDATAYHGRQAPYGFNIACATATDEGFERERAWVRAFWSALEPYHTSVYVNFLMDEGDERIRQAYGAERYARLQRIKHEWDPGNLFRLNQNVPPAP